MSVCAVQTGRLADAVLNVVGIRCGAISGTHVDLTGGEQRPEQRPRPEADIHTLLSAGSLG
jgi:hypothetical protein